MFVNINPIFQNVKRSLAFPDRELQNSGMKNCTCFLKFNTVSDLFLNISRIMAKFFLSVHHMFYVIKSKNI